MRWEQGRDQVERLLDEGRLQRVPPSRDQANRLIEQARRHVSSAVEVADTDPDGAYALAYDGARKALAAVLANEGLRATFSGGHIAVYEAVRAQLEPPMGAILRPFDRLRRRRNDFEYARTDVPAATAEDVRDDLPKVRAIIDLVARVVEEMSPF